MAESIVQHNKEKCFLCGGYAGGDPLDCHHIYGGHGKRELSEKYGLKVYLHHNSCHIFGANSVHQSAIVNKALKAVGQKIAMKYYGWSEDDFIKIFGKNYNL